MCNQICYNLIFTPFLVAAEAEKQYGAGNVKIYRSTFGNMYFSVLERKQQTLMKLVCAGPEEKVGHCASCIHSIDKLSRENSVQWHHQSLESN